MYCEYYQAQVLQKKTWFLSACLRNESNLVFARSIQNKKNTFEFFVPKFNFFSQKIGKSHRKLHYIYKDP